MRQFVLLIFLVFLSFGSRAVADPVYSQWEVFKNPSIFHVPVCGNGIVEEGEFCDGANCKPDCSGLMAVYYMCGNGAVQAQYGEECDDGNGSATDACPTGPGGTCKPATCGDGLVWAGHEECDNGAANSDNVANACRSDCALPSCGDGVVDSGEECDAGNAGADNCSDQCKNILAEAPLPNPQPEGSGADEKSGIVLPPGVGGSGSTQGQGSSAGNDQPSGGGCSCLACQ